MPQLPTKIKPKYGFSYFVHLGLLVALPLLVFIFIRLHIVQLALAVTLLSKWRMLAVRPRHWPANIRANAIDIIVGISVVIFMSQTDVQLFQVMWALAYGVWLIFIKPGTSAFWIAVQAMIGQLVGLMALYLIFGGATLFTLVIGAWVVAYSSARHFLGAFEEPQTRFLSYIWGYFAAAITWVLGHWLLFYSHIAQPTLLISVIGYGLASLYYLHEHDRLSSLVRRQIVLVMVAVIFIVLAFSDWGDKAL
jgi:hypothetical protein